VNTRRITKLTTLAVILTATAAFALSNRARAEQGHIKQDPSLQTKIKEVDRSESSKGLPIRDNGRRLFEEETFGGNGRTCLTCHSRETGTVSPEDAQKRFALDQHDPLFVHDGSDDGQGNGVTRMLADATVLVEVALPANVRLADDPNARSVVLRRGIPSTLNAPALDSVLMWDGREPNLETQAQNAIRGHAQRTKKPSLNDLKLIAQFERSDDFFSSNELLQFAKGGPAPTLPEGITDSEKRGRLFFVDAPFNGTSKLGTCALCHSGPMLNEPNRFSPVPAGTRFQTILVSEFNFAGNPVRDFIFTNPDGTETVVHSPDPGRALITGDPSPVGFKNQNAFKIPSLWGVKRTAPYFHDNSAKTLEQLAAHYAAFFAIISTPGGTQPAIVLTEQDQADIVAYLKLLE
jgi:cytochrome c peroxidase